MAPSKNMKKKRIVIGVVAFLIAATVIIVPITLEVTKEREPPANLNARIECLPFKNVTEETCHAAGCVWDPTSEVAKAPSCFLPDSSQYGYEINGPVMTHSRGLTIDLRRRRLSDGSTPPSLYGGDIDEVTFVVEYHTDTTLSFAIYPNGSDRAQWRPPVTINIPTESVDNQQYTVELANQNAGEPFNFKIIRKSSQAVIFDSSAGGLTVAEQFLMISTKLPTHYLYGFGENTHDSFQHDMQYRTWPIFTRDISPSDDDINLYGAHPFYMCSENDGSSHGVFLFNSHAIDVTTMPNPGLTIRTIGGMLEFFVFLGPEPETVVQQYTDVIGKTFMPPYFALGFQLSRWGYKNTSEIRTVIDRTRATGIPHDIQYADIDYMDDRRDFTIDPVNFGDLPQLVDDVKHDGLRFVLILDPAIAIDYETYERGRNPNVFVQWANSSIKPPDQPSDDDTLIGNVWPSNKTVFPDFFKNATKTWWTNEISLLYEKLKFDALWIDMNEVSNFDTNGLSDKLQCPENKWDDPPYETMAAYTGYSGVDRLSDKTICMVATFGDQGQHLHYNVHNLYGHSQAIVTQSAVRQVLGKRSMVFSRSTFAGSGKYSGHWLGDNFSTWDNLRDSIIGMMEFNIFGIPYIGADICGFILDTTEELCERWMEAGAFYPFSRNHNNIESIDQDPGIWPNTVGTSGRRAFLIRYRLLPYLYTLFYDSHLTGSTVVRPLYHEYPKDIKARSVERQFLWGSAFLISPVMEEGKTAVDVYIPDDVWYDYYTGIEVIEKGSTTLSAPRDYIPLHIRGGYILPAQKPDMNTMLSRKNDFELLVALKNQRARGKLFWDDGESIDTVGSGEYQINTFDFDENTLTHNVINGASPAWNGITPAMSLIQVMGWPVKPTNVTIEWATGQNQTLDQADYTFDETSKLLNLHTSLDLNSNWTVKIL